MQCTVMQRIWFSENWESFVSFWDSRKLSRLPGENLGTEPTSVALASVTSLSDLFAAR